MHIATVVLFGQWRKDMFYLAPYHCKIELETQFFSLPSQLPNSTIFVVFLWVFALISIPI